MTSLQKIQIRELELTYIYFQRYRPDTGVLKAVLEKLNIFTIIQPIIDNTERKSRLIGPFYEISARLSRNMLLLDIFGNNQLIVYELLAVP